MIIAGMSGGVDSSVAALLLKRRGANVRGIYMNNWDSQDPACRSTRDRADALRVCGQLDIPFQVVDYCQAYQENVFAEFLSDYKNGLTPNPDILCNREIKFKAFLEQALALGADSLATGHYARKAWINGRWALLRGVDTGKDQSYFLQAITQAALARAEFPVGELPKAQVRVLALEAGLGTATKKDSTGICFIGEQDFKTFLARYLPAQPGVIEDEQGVAIGTHTGALFYTVGQRAPLGGVRGHPNGTWFVLSKDVTRNVLIVGQGASHPRLMAQVLTARDANWIAGAPPADVFEGQVQIRHLGAPEPAQITVDQDGGFAARFHHPVRGVAPGQAAGVYQGDVCLGGGFIVG